MLAGVLMSVGPHVSCAFLHWERAVRRLVSLPAPGRLNRDPRLVRLSQFAGNVHEGPANL